LASTNLPDLVCILPAKRILINTTGLTGQKLSIAETYNRIGETLQTYSDQNALEIEVALAVWNAESSGLSFKPTVDGIPIRFENNIFWDALGANAPTDFNRYFNDAWEEGGNGKIGQWFFRGKIGQHFLTDNTQAKLPDTTKIHRKW
jgi:hypothetical protein